MNKLKNILKNPYVFSSLSRFLIVFVGLIFTVILSRYLGATIKGQVAFVSSVTGITSIIFEFGIHQAYPYFKKSSNTDILPVFMRIALVLLGICTGISVLTIWLADLSPKYIAVLLINPFMVYNRVVSYITLVETPNKKNATELIVHIAELLFVVVLWLLFSASFVIGVSVIAFKDIVLAIGYTFQWRKRIFIRNESIQKWIFKVIQFGFFPMLSLLMTTLNYRIDVIMLEGNVSDAAIGVYSVGVMIAERVWMIPDAMKGVLVSKITKGKDASEVAYVIRICNTVCLIILLAIVTLGAPLIKFIFGSEYDGAYQVTLILLVGAILMVYYKMIGSYNIVMGKQKISFYFLLISVICNVISNRILIPIWGIFGAGVASVISYSVCSILFIVYFCGTIGIRFKDMLFLTKADYINLKGKLKRKNKPDNSPS